MAAKYSPVSGILRVYDSEEGYDNRAPFRAVTSVVWTSDDRVVLFGTYGKYKKQDILDVFSELHGMGARTAEMARAKGRKMPLGVLVRSEGKEDWYEINLDTVLKK